MKLILFLAQIAVAASISPLKLVNTIDLQSSEKVKGAGFINILENPQTGDKDLFISTFSMWGSDKLLHIPSVKNIKALDLQTVKSTRPITWPNTITRADVKNTPGL